jgi:hypothetical protein
LKKRTYFVEFTFDFWQILYTEEGVYEGRVEKVFSTPYGSNSSRAEANAELVRLIATKQLPDGRLM